VPICGVIVAVSDPDSHGVKPTLYAKRYQRLTTSFRPDGMVTPRRGLPTHWSCTPGRS
jgi:hypothetical protein